METKQKEHFLSAKKPTKQNIYVFGNEVQCLFSIDTDGLFGLRPEPHKGQIITNDVIEF